MGNTDALNVKIEKVEEKINTLQKEMTNLIGMLSNTSKSTSSAMSKKQEPQTEAITPASIMPIQSGRFIILHCKQWLDFQALALNAQTVSFTCKEAEKVFKAEALKGNQLILFSGALPNLAVILKTWLSWQLRTNEVNVLEGFLETPK
ncbi:MAG TPA: hypothetical protein VF350_07360 [Candidatus Bathyarchaeia archaeon]